MAQNTDLVALGQFKHVVRRYGYPVQAPLLDLGDDLRSATGASWPGRERGSRPRQIEVSDRPNEANLGSPAALQLRLRAVFGVSVRPEIVRVLLHASGSLTASEVARDVHYTRRQVAAALESLARTSFVVVRAGAGSKEYRLDDRSAVTEVFGPIGWPVDWAQGHRLVVLLLALLDDLRAHDLSAPDAEGVRRLRTASDVLDDATRAAWQAQIVRSGEGSSTVERVEAAASTLLGRLSAALSDRRIAEKLAED